MNFQLSEEEKEQIIRKLFPYKMEILRTYIDNALKNSVELRKLIREYVKESKS